jgi:multiple sugar transport system permease protein
MIVFVWTFAPIIWTLVSSISTRLELLSIPPHWIPMKPTLENYMQLLITGSVETSSGTVTGSAVYFKRAMANSLIVAGSSTVIILILSSLSGYAFARLRFPGKNLLFIIFIFIIAVPVWAFIIPLYSMMAHWGLLDTYSSLILVYSSWTAPFCLWIMRSYYESIPLEIEESAMTDGCNRFQVLRRIVLPLSVPGLVSAAVVSFLSSWNEFTIALIFTSTYNAKTVPVIISEFISKYTVEYELMCAGGILSIIAPLLLVLFLQKYLITGMIAGAVKA